MSENLAALLYLVAKICFIMALRGLSSQRRRALAISMALQEWSSRWRRPSPVRRWSAIG
jgi:hypothetical protein